MEKFQDGDWHVFRERTRKPLGRFRVDASQGLLRGLSALVTVHNWDKNVCRVSAPGAIAEVTYEKGERGWNNVTCRISLTGFFGRLFKDKILSDIEHTTVDICGAVLAENRNVFIVHGHNHSHRAELAAFLREVRLEPIILDEQDDMGMTIIEKFEAFASDCAFAFILMTPDDKGESRSEPHSRWRARQNVIMELGWFMAHLGRERVVILYQGELEIPSDILGVVFLRFDKSLREVEEPIKRRMRGSMLVE